MSTNPNQWIQDGLDKIAEFHKELRRITTEIFKKKQETARQKEIETLEAAHRKEQDGGRKRRH
jgi:hypothetical protein